MVATLHSIQILLALALIALILLQRPSSDASGIPVGGDSASFLHTRRGAERFFFVLTIAVSIAFAAVSLAAIVLTA
ncbi:MAG: preprotein translocase subunit SecG [Minisyncoccia bacterium]